MNSEYNLENNLSSRESENLPYYFIFTRHAFSCNNATDTSGWLKKQINLFKKVLDPHLTDYGIVNTLAVGQRNSQKYNSSTVFVSCLIRTWETAVLLYLPNIGLTDNLNIIVSPFLKEKHGTFRIGNYPITIDNNGVEEIDINACINNFIVFLKLLNTKYTHYFNNQKLAKIVVNYNGKKYEMKSIFTPNKPSNIYTNIQSDRKKIGGTVDSIVSSNQEIIIPNQPNNTLHLITDCNPITTPNYLYPNVGFDYYVNNSKENLLLFILWVTKNINNGTFSSYNNEIHIVCHSNIMQSFIKIMKNMIHLPQNIPQPILNCSSLTNYVELPNITNDLKNITEQPIYKSIIKTNSWSIESLITFTENALNINISKMTTGVPKLKDTDPTEHELCSRTLNREIVPTYNLTPVDKSKLEFGGKRKKSKTKRIRKKHKKGKTKRNRK